MTQIVVVTTFPTSSWDVYARKMLESFVAHWPKEISLLVQLDDDLLLPDVKRSLRDIDLIAVGWSDEHKAFVERNMGKDDPMNYRMQPVRFCHKVFTIKRALDVINEGKEKGAKAPRYLIWLDADVITTRKVTVDDLKECLPKEGDAVAYLGRKDWDHSECGWLAFDLEKGGANIINAVYESYAKDYVLNMEQQHDSWVWDRVMEQFDSVKPNAGHTNLTPEAIGRDVWQQSPMGKWSTHYKGPEGKAKLGGHKMFQQPQTNAPALGNVRIQTKNAIPHEEIRAHIAKNQTLIRNWVKPCVSTDEELIIVSAGPLLVAEDVRKEVAAGKKIVAVKHALKPLRAAGIKPWACILLDPRDHVANFVQDADRDVLWFVASQVTPMATLELLARGCNVWGYHAAVGAGEDEITAKQEHAIITGGSATATRGLFMLHHLGFSNFTLYGYDLCLPDKPDLAALDEFKQPKFFEMSVGMNDPLYNMKRFFHSEPQLMAQFEELNELIKSKKFNIRAYGDGIVPFMLKAQEIAEMRRKELREKHMGPKPLSYAELLAA